MSPWDGTRLAILVAIVGIILQRRFRQCWSFLAYLLVVEAGTNLRLLWPEAYLTCETHREQQFISDGLKIAIALELGWHAFRCFPRVRRLAILAFGGLAVVSAAILLGSPLPTEANASVQVQWQPRVLVCTVWLMTGVSFLTHWFRIPVPEYQRAILDGFVPYLVVQILLTDFLRAGLARLAADPGTLAAFNELNGVAFLLVCAWWAWIAWRPEPQVRLPAVLPEDFRRAVAA